MNKGFVQKRRKKKKGKVKEKNKEKRKKKKKKRKKRRSTQTKEKKESKYGLWKLGRGTVRPKDIFLERVMLKKTNLKANAHSSNS